MLEKELKNSAIFDVTSYFGSQNRMLAGRLQNVVIIVFNQYLPRLSKKFYSKMQEQEKTIFSFSAQQNQKN